MQTLERTFFVGSAGSIRTLTAGEAHMCQEQEESQFGQWSSARDRNGKKCGQWGRDQVMAPLIVADYASVY